MNLYKLTSDFVAVQQMVEDEELDFTCAIDTLDSIEAAIEVKVANTVYILRNMESYASGLDHEIKRLQAKQKALNNNQEGMKNFLFGQLEFAGLTEMKTDICTIKQANNPPSVLIDDPELIPVKYQTIIPESYSIRKSEISKDLKAGFDVPGCQLTHSKRWVIK